MLAAAVAWAMRSWSERWRIAVASARSIRLFSFAVDDGMSNETSIEPGGFVRMHFDQLGMHVASGRHARFQGGETSSGRRGYDGREGLSSGKAAAGLPRKR